MRERYRIVKEFTFGLAVFLMVLIAVMIIVELRKDKSGEKETLLVNYLFDDFVVAGSMQKGKCNVGIRNLGDAAVNGWEVVFDCGDYDAQISGAYNCSISVEGHVMVLKSIPESAKVEPGEQSPIFGFEVSVPAGSKFAFRSVEVRELESENMLQGNWKAKNVVQPLE